MDDREKIGTLLWQWDDANDELWSKSKDKYLIQADQILKELGYRKPGELLTPEEIGDNLDLEVDATYPRSGGGLISTISVDKLLQAQLDKGGG